MALAIFLVVMAAAGYYVFNETLKGGQLVTVPNILQMPLGEASMELARQGLEMGQPLPGEHATIPKDHIIAQRPAAGTVVRTGRKVVPTINMGAQAVPTPDLVRRSLKDATQTLEQSRFRVGSVVRIAHRTPRDTVIAQDPPAGQTIVARSDVHLLVSAGTETRGAFMPNLRGMGIEEAEQEAARLNLRLVPNEVDYPGAQFDVVLDQRPPANAMVYPGDVVTYDVKLSGGVDAADARHQATVVHEMTIDWYDRDVRFELVDHRGARQVLPTSYPRDYSVDARRSRKAGSKITISNISYIGEATLEVYVDGELSASYPLRDGLPPERMEATQTDETAAAPGVL